MSIFDAEHVKIHGAVVVWDGITQPDVGQDGKPKFSLKVVVPPHSPDLQDIVNLANTTLQTSPFKGILPQGALIPGMAIAGPQEFDGLFNGWSVFNCNTQRLPTVYDELGKVMDPMQYGPLIFGGQQVDVLIHCYHYDKAGNKGIATGLDAFSIIVSANAQRQNFGGSGIDTSSAFGPGGGGGGQPAQQQGGYQQPAQQGQQVQQGGYQQPAQNGQQPAQQQGGYQQPAQQGQVYVDPNAQQQAAPQNNGQAYQPAQQGQQQQQGAYVAPQQANGYIPNQ